MLIMFAFPLAAFVGGMEVWDLVARSGWVAKGVLIILLVSLYGREPHVRTTI